MLSHEEARARVARGAAHLDVVRPGWFNRIDTGTLTLHDSCGCIVGQLCGASNGTFLRALAALLIDHSEADSLGFNHDGGDEWYSYYLELGAQRAAVLIYKPLQDAWIEAIADRRLAADIHDPIVSEPVSSPVGV